MFPWAVGQWTDLWMDFDPGGRERERASGGGGWVGVGGGWEWGVGAVVISHPRIPPHTMNIRTTSVECL